MIVISKLVERIAYVLLACQVCCMALAQPPGSNISPVNVVAVAPDGETILVGGQAGLTRHTWNSPGPQNLIETIVETVHAIRWSPNGKLIAVAGGSAGEYGQLQVFTWPDLQPRSVDVIHDDVIYAVAWYQHGTRLLAAGLDGRLSSIDLSKGETDWSTEAHNRGATGLILLRDAAPQTEAAPLCVSCGMDQTLRVWRVADEFQQVRSLNNHTAGVNCIALRPSKTSGPSVVASAGNDGTIRFWQPEIGRMMRFVRLESVPVTLAWTAEGDVLLAGCRDGTVRVIDPDRAMVKQTIQATSDWTTAIALNRTDETLLAGCATGLVVVRKPF